MASYPSAPVVFPARSDGQTVFAQHINALQDEVAAIEASLVGGTLPNPQKIVGGATGATRPMLMLDGGTPRLGRVMSNGSTVQLSQNLYETLTGWFLDDTTNAGYMIAVNPIAGVIYFYYAAPGANPRPLVNTFGFDSTGALFERLRSVAMGDWTYPAFNAGNFAGAGSMTWTVTAGGVNNYGYALFGRMCVFAFDVTGTIGGTPSSQITIALPQTAVKSSFAPCWTQSGTGLMTCGGNTMTIYKDAALTGNYVAGSCRAAGVLAYAV